MTDDLRRLRDNSDAHEAKLTAWRSASRRAFEDSADAPHYDQVFNVDECAAAEQASSG